MKQISLGYHLRHVATMLIAISAVTLNGDPTDDPFRPGAYPASVRRLSWDATSAFPNPNWGEVIEIDGWLKVVSEESGLKCLLFKSQEARKFQRPKSFLECELDAPTIDSYKDGSIKEWSKLDGRYVRIWAVFGPTAQTYSDYRVGWLRHSFRLVFFTELMERDFVIEAKAIQWPAGKISVEGWPNGYGGEVETPPALGPGTEQGSGKSD